MEKQSTQYSMNIGRKHASDAKLGSCDVSLHALTQVCMTVIVFSLKEMQHVLLLLRYNDTNILGITTMVMGLELLYSVNKAPSCKLDITLRAHAVPQFADLTI